MRGPSESVRSAPHLILPLRGPLPLPPKGGEALLLVERNGRPATVIALSDDTHCAYLRLPHRLIDTSLEGLIEAIRGP